MANLLHLQVLTERAQSTHVQHTQRFPPIDLKPNQPRISAPRLGGNRPYADIMKDLIAARKKLDQALAKTQAKFEATQKLGETENNNRPWDLTGNLTIVEMREQMETVEMRNKSRERSRKDLADLWEECDICTKEALDLSQKLAYSCD